MTTEWHFPAMILTSVFIFFVQIRMVNGNEKIAKFLELIIGEKRRNRPLNFYSNQKLKHSQQTRMGYFFRDSIEIKKPPVRAALKIFLSLNE